MKKMRLDIGGEKGNAFYILGLVKTLTGENKHAEKVRGEMMSGDYNHLLKTFTEAFPIVEIYSHRDLGESVDTDLYIIDDAVMEL